MSYDARLAELGINLPEAPAPAGMYAPVVQSGNLLYLAGHIPTKARGKVGSSVTEQEANAAAEEVAHLMLATIRNHLGTLDRVERIVKVFGLVNCTLDFASIPQVINGFSQVMLNVFGEAGRAARSAVGAASLPLGVPVEVEAVVEVRGEQN
jgi:enamine deaminase RidA (YjgF/YER057c/UK114 family)